MQSNLLINKELFFQKKYLFSWRRNLSCLIRELNYSVIEIKSTRKPEEKFSLQLTLAELIYDSTKGNFFTFIKKMMTKVIIPILIRLASLLIYCL